MLSVNRNECSFIMTNADVTLLFILETNEDIKINTFPDPTLSLFSFDGQDGAH